MVHLYACLDRWLPAGRTAFCRSEPYPGVSGRDEMARLMSRRAASRRRSRSWLPPASVSTCTALRASNNVQPIRTSCQRARLVSCVSSSVRQRARESSTRQSNPGARVQLRPTRRRLPVWRAVHPGMRPRPSIIEQWRDSWPGDPLTRHGRAINTVGQPVPSRCRKKRGLSTCERAKTEAATDRRVPLSSAVIQQFREWRLCQQAEFQRTSNKWARAPLSDKAVGPVFTSTRGIRLERNLNRAFERICAQAGASHTLHGLRHDFGSTLVAAGIPVATVAAILGHSSPVVTTRLYLHSHDPAAQAAVEVAAGLLRIPRVGQAGSKARFSRLRKSLRSWSVVAQDGSAS